MFGSSEHWIVVRCSSMWNWCWSQFTSRLLDSSRSQWIVSPLVTRTLPIVICEPPPVKRPVATVEQLPGIETVVDADCPPANPSPQLLTAIAVTVAVLPAGASTDPENEFPGSANAPEATVNPLTRMSTRVFCAKTLVGSQAVAT